MSIAEVGPEIGESLAEKVELLFLSQTQAYRETFLGSMIAKLEAPEVNLSLAYVNLGPDAYNGRTIDEKIVNPVLQSNRIPVSSGPYLNVFRRSVRFIAETRSGVRDKQGYDAFLSLMEAFESADSEGREKIVAFVLRRFLLLREASQVPVTKLNRVSLVQLEYLIEGLLVVPSGGLIPVVLISTAFAAMNQQFALSWEVAVQGINEADAASSAGGDITIRSGEKIVFAAEVTERPLDRERVLATFQNKIGPAAIEDYLFFVKLESASPEALNQARQYFAQGSEVNVLDLRLWLSTLLSVIGKEGRSIFNKLLTERLDKDETPRSMKMAWNRLVDGMTAT